MTRPDGTTVYFYRTNFVTSADLVRTMETLLKVPGVVLRDFPRQNQVLIEGTPDAIECALDAIAYFDVPLPQVFVEAKIIEVTYDSNFEFGVSLLLDRDKAGPDTFFRGASAALNPPSFFQSQLPGNIPFQGVGISFGFVGSSAEKYGALDLTLQAMQRSGTAEVLSRPSIVATQGKQASVLTGQETPVITITNAESSPPGVRLLLQTSYVKTNVGLIVTPQHIGDAFVTLDVDPKVEGVTGYSLGEGGTSAPIVSKRQATTTVTMADGETLVIGGLYTTSTVLDEARVPLLCDLPLLGELFKRRKDVKIKTELVFFITAHILRKQADFKVITPPGEVERLERERRLRPSSSAFPAPSVPNGRR